MRIDFLPFGVSLIQPSSTVVYSFRLIFIFLVQSRRILIYVRHYLECVFRGDAIPNFDDIAITVDLQTLEVGKRYTKRAIISAD